MPAFLVHGVPDTHFMWEPLRTHLTRDDVIAPDLPAFGNPRPDGFAATKEAYAEWLVAEIEAVGEPVDLVGHDWGSILVVRAATTRPDLIRTLAYGGGPIDPAYVWHNIAQIWQTPGAGEELMTGFTPDATAAALATEQGEEMAKATAGRIDDAMKAAILDLYRSAVTVGAEWGPALEGFDRPSLGLWGADDPYVSPDFGRSMAARLGGRAVVFEDTFHWWPIQRAKEAAAELEQLWTEVE